jgi:hypothetical protein
MTRAKLAEEIKKLLPDEKDKRIRQAIMKAYGGATIVAVGVRNTIFQENRLQNGILVEGTVAITAPTSASLSGWAWVIDFAIQEGANQTIAITAPDATHPRIDYFYGDDAGLIHYAAGILDAAGNSLFPSIPEGNIILKKVLRNTDGSNEAIENPQPGWIEAPINDQIYGRKNGAWISIDAALAESQILSKQENTDVDVTTSPEAIALIPISTFTGVFIDYVVKNGSNLRIGTIMASYSGSTVVFNELSSADIGSTSDVSLSVDLVDSNLRLLATVLTDNWSIKTLIRKI